jgi:LacI family transcriptional regulator, galactose operon repressor
VSGKGKTLKDLAAKLEVSVATVSRALAGSERIAAGTRERVVAAARELGYVPNRAARALVSGRSGFAGLVLPIRGHGFEDPFLGELVSGLGTGLATHGIDLFLGAVPDGKSELSVIEHIVAARRADGLVLARIAENDPRVAYLLERAFPFVAHGRTRDPSGYAWLDTDGEAAFAEAFELLYGLGHRRFGFVTIAEPMNFRRLRAIGLEGAIARRGDPAVTLDSVAPPRFDRASRVADINRLLDRPDRPTAVLALFDGLAIAVMEEATRLGLSVPGDLSVIGFDDIPAAAHAPPGLTTFDARIHDCAIEIAGMLVRAMASNEGPPETKLLRPRLVARGSHGPAPAR